MRRGRKGRMSIGKSIGRGRGGDRLGKENGKNRRREEYSIR